MTHRIALCSIVLIIASQDAVAQEKAGILQMDWKLKLLPADAPCYEKSLAGTSWMQQGVLRRNGTGWNWGLEFPKPGKDNQAEIHQIAISRKISNVTNTIRVHKLRADRCLVEFDRSLHTIHLRENKSLVLSALVPIGKLQWYFAEGKRSDKEITQLKEFRLEFKDDPLEKVEGAVRISWHIIDAGKGIEAQQHHDAEFVARKKTDYRVISFRKLENPIPGLRDMHLYAVDGPAELATGTRWGNGVYGLGKKAFVDD